MSHPNSRIVTIKRKLTGIEELNAELETVYGQDINKVIGGYIAGPGIPANGRGLEDWEVDILLPRILMVSPDKDITMFLEKVNLYYNDIRNFIPKLGLILETGLTQDNSKPISKENLPLNVTNYVAFRHIQSYPHTAKSEREAKGNPLKFYWIEDKNAALTQTIETQDIKDEAMKLYLIDKSNKEKIKMLAELMADSIVENEGKSFEEMSSVLREKVEKHPSKFIEAATDKNLQIKYFIRQCISNNILRTVGTTVLDVESGDTIGNTMEATVIYLNDATNIKVKAILEAKLKEKLKAKNSK